jgi:hypothetical protein
VPLGAVKHKPVALVWLLEGATFASIASVASCFSLFVVADRKKNINLPALDGLQWSIVGVRFRQNPSSSFRV